MQHLRFRSRIPVPVEDLFAWHARDGAFERLVPPWQKVRIIRRDGSIRDGDVLHMRIQAGPLFKDWVALHSDYVQDEQFRDTQVKGPFNTWVHTHRTHRDSQTTSILDDFIAYRLPAPALSQSLVGGIAHAELRRMFRYRHLRTRLDVVRHFHYRKLPRVRVAILGEHPFADQLGAFLTGGGHSLSADNASEIQIDVGELREPGNRLISLRTLATGETHYVAVPDVVIGPSFGATGLRARLTTRRATDSDWIAEDDLIGMLYDAVLTPGSSKTPYYRAFSNRAAAASFLTGRL